MAKFRFLKLPGSYNFVSSLKTARKLKQLQKLLGQTFFPRINNIYTNVLDAIAYQKNAYLSSALSSSLSKSIIKKRSQLNQNGYRMKLIHFQNNGAPLNTRTSHTWMGPGINISVQSKVYFGQKFDQEKADEIPFRVINTGVHRAFVLNKNQDILTSLKNFCLHQTYEFKVKVQSCDILQVVDSSNKPVQIQEDKTEKQINSKKRNQRFTTQMILKTGNDQFNWVITDINNIMKDEIQVQAYLNK